MAEVETKKKKKKSKTAEPVAAEPAPVAEPVKEKKKKSKKEAAPEPVAATPAPVAEEPKKKKKDKKAAAEAAAPEPVVEEAPKKRKAEEPVIAVSDAMDTLASLKTNKKKKAEEPAELEDETLQCKDCGSDFVFSVDDQQFHKDKGFEQKPARCIPCRRAKKDKLNGGPAPCYAFQNGSCDRESCRFSHDANAGGGGGGGRGGRGGGSRGGGRGGRGGRGGGGGGGGGVCYAFQKGECSRGDGCRFSHEGGGNE